MISYTLTSGKCEILELGDGSYTVVLKEFSGTLTPSSDVKRIRVITYGDNMVSSPISLSKIDDDCIIIEGQGSLRIPSLTATSVNIFTQVSIEFVKSHNTRIQGGSVKGVGSSTLFESTGHLSIVDSVVSGTNIGSFINSPYSVIDNCNISITSLNKPINDDGCHVVEHVDGLVKTDTEYKCSAKIVDDLGVPKNFIYKGNDTSRQILYPYKPAVLANEYDLYEDKKGITDPNLHRRIDNHGVIYKGLGEGYITDEQINRVANNLDIDIPDATSFIPDETIEGVVNHSYSYTGTPEYNEITPENVQKIIDGTYVFDETNRYVLDEVEPREYEVGIYGLNSYRTTSYTFHSDNSPLNEIP